MVFCYGTRLYGNVDGVGKWFHVATKFGHLFYFPVIPLGSYVVLADWGNGFQGVRIELSGLSLLAAWARAGLVVLAAACLTFILAEINGPSSLAVPIGIGVSALCAFAASYYVGPFARAAHFRARELADILGMDAVGQLAIDVMYKRISEDEANHQVRRMQMRAEAEERAAAAERAEAEERALADERAAIHARGDATSSAEAFSD